jgi:type 1 glutamine amidotransferase
MPVGYRKRAGVASTSHARYRLAMPLASLLLAVLAQSPQSLPTPRSPSGAVTPIRTVLLTGANNHDWKWTAPEVANTLTETGRFEVATVTDPATWLTTDAVQGVQLFVLDYNGPRWGDAAEAAFVAAVQAGAGVSVLHAADNAFPGWAAYENLVGLLWREGAGHGAYHAFDVCVVDHHHAITVGMADLHLHPDELYHGLTAAPLADYRVLLTAFSDPKTGGTGRHEPMATAGRFGSSRVFHTTLGHVWAGVPATRATWLDPQLRRLVARGSEWAATGQVTLSPVPLNALGPTERAEGFELLFDGRSLRSWRAYRGEAPPPSGWVVRDGAIVHEPGGGGGDLDFRFSFRVAPGANSGVIWHVLESADQTYMTGPEYQVLDDLAARPDGKHGVGALYDLVPATGKTTLPAGEWNEGRIVVHGGRVQHWLNGSCVLDVPCAGPEWEALVQQSKFRDWPFARAGRGHLALQDHGDEVAYRNLRLRSL